MKILIRQFLGKPHSWVVVGHGIAQSLIEQNHQVDLFSTDGKKHLPKHLENNLIGYIEENKPEKVFGRIPDEKYDCQISYTCMKNFPALLANGDKNRFGIWCYEWAGKNVLPNGFAKYYKFCDKILAPSNFAKQVFVDSGVPNDHITVVPHGILSNNYRKNDTIKLPTNKKFKLFANIAQLHLRKNIAGLLEAYGKAFTNKDDVCLILKAGKEEQCLKPFQVSLKKCLNEFKIKYPQHAEIKILNIFVDDMSALYRSIDAVVSLTHCEAFYFPGLEAMATGKLSIVSQWGGQLDFLNNDNALLISGCEVRADPKSMYWESKNNAIWFKPSIDDAVDKLRYAEKNFKALNAKIKLQQEDVLIKYDWRNITKQILDLCQ